MANMNTKVVVLMIATVLSNISFLSALTDFETKYKRKVSVFNSVLSLYSIIMI